MLLGDWVRDAVRRLSVLYPQQEARGIVSILCREMLGVSSWQHIVEPAMMVPADKVPALEAAMERLEAAEPVQYVLGRAEFFGHTLRVSPAVLIPRPETELLVDKALRVMAGRPLRVLDLCTGSGCIAWSIAIAVPGAMVTGVDISEDALRVAREQDFPGEDIPSGVVAPRFIQADVLETGRDYGWGRFDLIVSNPPYVLEAQRAQIFKNVLDYEPQTAVFAPPQDPLAFYRAIVLWGSRLLDSGGMVLMEINDILADQYVHIPDPSLWRDVTLDRDLSGAQRYFSITRR